VWTGRDDLVERGGRRLSYVLGDGATLRWFRSTGALAAWLWSVGLMLLIDLTGFAATIRPLLVAWFVVVSTLLVSTFVFGWPDFLVPPGFRNGRTSGSD